MTNSFFADLDTTPPQIQQQSQSNPFFSDLQEADERAQFLALPFEERARISRELGEKASEQARAAIGAGMIPGGSKLVEKARKAGFIEPSLNPTAEAVAEFGGAAVPIGLIGKGVQLATNPLIGGVKGAGLLQAGLTGAAYKGAESLIGEQKLPETPEVAKEAALFAAGHGIAQGVGKLYSKIKGLPNAVAKTKPPYGQKLIQTTINQGEGPPPQSMYLTEEKALNKLQEAEIAARPPEPSPPPGPFQQIKTSQAQQPPSLQGRVTPQQSRQMGLTISVTPRNPTTRETVLNIFPNRIENTTHAGRAATAQIRELDAAAHERVNALYARSRELNSALSEIRPELIQSLQNRIAEINRIASPSTIQRRVRREAQAIMNRYVTFDGEGNITGYVPVSNQDLIDQVQSLRQLVDYDYAHGNPSGIFRPLINDIEGSIIHSERMAGGQEAIEALGEARNEYREWTQTFNNDYVNPFRNETNHDYSKNFKSLLDSDNYNVISPILEQTPQGQVLNQSIRREIVEKKLGKFIDDPRGADPVVFDKELRELQPVLTPQESTRIRNDFNAGRQRLQRRVTNQTPQKAQEGLPKNLDKVVEKYTNKKPEAIEKLMNSRSGIRQLREDLGKTEKTKEIFNELSKQKIRNILEDVKTGRDLNIKMKNYANREIFEEILGEEAVSDILEASEKAGAEELASEEWKKKMIKIGKKTLGVTKFGTLGLFIP